ncbi:hypothetical protein ACFV8T_26320 [Streptomyces sp. NPDC059832]|uniref:hypothetical protein n=1 Tax=Streptomyces sp. NPDC059832 TaxID=3346966 RepID=UPI00364F48FC
MLSTPSQRPRGIRTDTTTDQAASDKPSVINDLLGNLLDDAVGIVESPEREWEIG